MTGRFRDRLNRSARWPAIAGFGAAMLIAPGCSEETRTVSEVKRAFAMRAAEGEVEIGTSGRLAAAEVDRATLDLLDVRFDIGGAREQELMMHAERAEIIIDPDNDTMLIRFHNVTAATTEGGLTQEPVLVTEPWPLSVNVVAD